MSEHEHEHGHEEEEEELHIVASIVRPRRHRSNTSPTPGLEKSATATTSEVEFVNSDDHDNPDWRRHGEAQPIELFYDLFFVANLTNFTGDHPINSVSTLSSYVGFFCILWFTWYQVVLFDVRFSVDSVFDRICKALQFGVMVGFAATGAKFDPSSRDSAKFFKTLTLLLMTSRLVLMLQYLIALIQVRKYQRLRFPVFLIAVSSGVAALIYLGLFWTFKPDAINWSYIAWYVVAVLETAMTTTVSCVYRQVSFKGTHLCERLSLLTLIILGEGIILLMKSIYYIVNGFPTYELGTGGLIASSVLIIYFYYMMYYDRMVEEHFGTIRQQIWSFLHFPFHTAMVLTLEAVRQFVILGQATIAERFLLSPPGKIFVPDFSTAAKETIDFAAAGNAIKNAAQEEVFRFVKDGYDYSKYNKTVADATKFIIDGASQTPEKLYEAQRKVFSALMDTEYLILGVKAPKAKDTYVDSETSRRSMYEMVFVYFMVTGGLVFVINGALGWIAKPPKTLGDKIRGGSYFVFGVALAMLALAAANPKTTFDSYFSGQLVLPTILLCQLAVLLFRHAHIPSFRKHD